VPSSTKKALLAYARQRNLLPADLCRVPLYRSKKATILLTPLGAKAIQLMRRSQHGVSDLQSSRSRGWRKGGCNTVPGERKHVAGSPLTVGGRLNRLGAFGSENIDVKRTDGTGPPTSASCQPTKCDNPLTVIDDY